MEVTKRLAKKELKLFPRKLQKDIKGHIKGENIKLILPKQKMKIIKTKGRRNDRREPTDPIASDIDDAYMEVLNESLQDLESRYGHKISK